MYSNCIKQKIVQTIRNDNRETNWWKQLIVLTIKMLQVWGWQGWAYQQDDECWEKDPGLFPDWQF